jgi:adhesin/invasin
MRLLSLLALPVSRLLPLLCALLLAAVFLSACDKVPLLAPTESTITLTVSTTVVPVNGSATIIASVTESAGTPVQNGTVVTFTSSFGNIDPAEARTEGGKATVRFVATAQSGTARVGAFSGAARAEELELLVGGAAAETIVLRANPRTVSASDGRSEIVATVLDASGNPLPGVPVTFSAATGQVSPGTAVTDQSGEARTTFTGSTSGQVTANAGGKTAMVEITVASPGVTITAPATIEAGIAATFTLTPATGSGAIRDVVIDWGDNTPPTRLGTITGATPVAHVFPRAGVFTVRATVTDAQGVTGTSPAVVNVTEQSAVAVTLTGTPNPVSVSSATQQGLVTFTATAGGGLGGGTTGVSSYSWDFGDGGTAFTTGGSTNHRYAAPGTYTATVTARSTAGNSGVGQLTVRVNP